MHPLEGIAIINHHKELKKAPCTTTAWEIVEEFYKYFEKNGAEDMLWFMLSAAMVADNDHLEKHHRAHILFFFNTAKHFTMRFIFCTNSNQKHKINLDTNAIAYFRLNKKQACHQHRNR